MKVTSIIWNGNTCNVRWSCQLSTIAVSQILSGQCRHVFTVSLIVALWRSGWELPFENSAIAADADYVLFAWRDLDSSDWGAVSDPNIRDLALVIFPHLQNQTQHVRSAIKLAQTARSNIRWTFRCPSIQLVMNEADNDIHINMDSNIICAQIYNL